ncbi:hypothetical protein SAMN05192559_101368 [Halobacillus karajensis]|nr:hypothetical protein SAMN05192559_101368 [Halobacillus karajensis]
MDGLELFSVLDQASKFCDKRGDQQSPLLNIDLSYTS